MSDDAPSLSVAIVGAGPAGFYAADALVRKPEACRIDIIDRLPTPYGLVRAGVAPDHQSTKNVVRVYDRILQDDAVRLIGNIELGRDLTYDELKALYDVVILAIGAQAPRRLDAVHARHPYVHQHHVRLVVSISLKRSLPVPGLASHPQIRL